jgi:histone deacetylase 6
MMITPACYSHFINSLSCLSSGKLCVLLEGGYCIKSLSEGVALTVRSLLGYPCPRIESTTQPDSSFVKTLLNLTSVLKPYWKNLQFLNDADPGVKLNVYLSQWDEEHRKSVNFFSHESRPDTFEFDCYSALEFPQEEKTRILAQIDRLIETTSLFVPAKRTCLTVSNKSGITQDFDDHIVRFESSENLIWECLNKIGTKECNNGLVHVLASNIKPNDLSQAIQEAQKRFFKRVLVI